MDARTGCWLWNVNPRIDETVSWSGGCGPDGPATGHGRVEWRFEGKVSRFEGDLKFGRATGRGVYTWANGNRYDGDWKDGKRTGQGNMLWHTGNRYEGGWENGNRSGTGKMTFTNGNSYVGEWTDDVPNGNGEAMVNGKRYAGTWVMGCYSQDGQTAWIVVDPARCK